MAYQRPQLSVGEMADILHRRGNWLWSLGLCSYGTNCVSAAWSTTGFVDRLKPRVCFQLACARKSGLTGNSYNVSLAEYLGATYDASTTNLTYLIPAPTSGSSATKPVKLILSFSCPITPTSTLRQSLPAAYLSVYAEGSFDVSIYVDLNGQWVSGDRGSKIEWEYLTTDIITKSATGLKTWMVKKQQESLFTEINDRGEWGRLYFSGPDVSTRCSRLGY
jgi:Domain of unknown function (DUF5127)